MERFFVMAGAIFAFLGVLSGAFGAHGLKKYFEMNADMQTIYKTAVEYQMVHALGLLAIAQAASKWPNHWISYAGCLFIAGIVLFSGSLYALSLTRLRWWGAISPFGGMAFLVGWLCLAVGAYKGAPA